LPSPTEQQYREVVFKLSVSIEEIRGVFCNLRVPEKTRELYPFEPLKDILGLVREVGFGAAFRTDRAVQAHAQIEALWKDVRAEILKEFDREEPTFAHSHWADERKSRVYDENRILKKPG
jgi:hypothetical protein